jgi:hypothetical protein
MGVGPPPPVAFGTTSSQINQGSEASEPRDLGRPQRPDETSRATRAVGHRASEIVNDSGAEVDQGSPWHRSCRHPLTQPASCRSAIRPARPWAVRRSSALPIRRGLPGLHPSGAVSLSGPIKSAAPTAAATTDRDIDFGIYEVAASTAGSGRRVAAEAPTSTSIASRAAARRHDPQCVVATPGDGPRLLVDGRADTQTPTAGDRCSSQRPDLRMQFHVVDTQASAATFPVLPCPLLLCRRGDHQ